MKHNVFVHYSSSGFRGCLGIFVCQDGHVLCTVREDRRGQSKDGRGMDTGRGGTKQAAFLENTSAERLIRTHSDTIHARRVVLFIFVGIGVAVKKLWRGFGCCT